MSFATVAALLEQEHDLLSVLLVRAERLSDGADDALADAIDAVREELVSLELARAVVVVDLGIGDMPTLSDLIAAAPSQQRAQLAESLHELLFLTVQVDLAGEAAGLGLLVPPSLRDFLRR